MSRIRVIAILIPLIAAMLVSCGKNDPKPAADFVFVSPDEHNFLDPQKMSWLHDLRVAECMYEPLVRIKLPAMVIEPAAAEKWEVSDDQLTYTFHIRADAKWSNGDPLRASDFIYAWRRAMTPDLAADYSELLFRIKGGEAFFRWRADQLKSFLTPSPSGRGRGEGTSGHLGAPSQEKPAADGLPAKSDDPAKLERPLTPALSQRERGQELWHAAQQRFADTVGLRAPDDRTLIVTLEQPTPYFLELCAFITFAPVHAASVAPTEVANPATGMLVGDSTYWSDPARLVTNGPYVLARRRFKRDLLLTQNPHFWNRAAMQNKSILEKIVSDPRTQMMIYSTGQADWLPEIPSNSSMAADLISQKLPDVVTTPWAGTYFYSFNCLPKMPDGTNNPLADPRVRRALSMGIDRKTIVQRVTRLNQPQALTFIPPGTLPGYDAPVDAGAAYDVPAARKLLEEAGYPGGKGLAGLSILINTGAGHEAVAQQIKHAWEQDLGVVVTLEALEGKSFSERLKSQRYTIARASWIGDYRDATTFLDKYRAENGNNDAKYANPAYDALLDAAASETNPQARLVKLRDAEAMMLADAPIAPIYHYITINVFDQKKVRNLEPNIWNWRRLEFVKVERGGK